MPSLSLLMRILGVAVMIICASWLWSLADSVVPAASTASTVSIGSGTNSLSAACSSPARASLPANVLNHFCGGSAR